MKIATFMLGLCFLILGVVAVPSSTSAQRVRTYDLTCSSDNEQWHQCGTSFTNIANVELVRQISGSPCIQGQTWGFEARGVWVDRGCRAEFRVYGSGDRDQREDRDNRDRDGDRGDRDRDRHDRDEQRVVVPVAPVAPIFRGGQSVVINCKSDDERRHRCHVDGIAFRPFKILYAAAYAESHPDARPTLAVDITKQFPSSARPQTSGARRCTSPSTSSRKE